VSLVRRNVAGGLVCMSNMNTPNNSHVLMQIVTTEKITSPLFKAGI